MPTSILTMQAKAQSLAAKTSPDPAERKRLLREEKGILENIKKQLSATVPNSQ